MMNTDFTNRVKLLMEYDTSLTNTENFSKINDKIVILEQGLAPLIRAGFTGVFDDILRNVKGGLKNTSSITIKNLDDLILNIEKGLVSPATMGQIRRGLLKSGKISKNLQSQLVDDLLEVPGAIFKGGSTKDAVKKSYKMLGYSDEVSEEIATKVMKLRKAKGIKPVVADPLTKTTFSRTIMSKATEMFRRGDSWNKFKKYALLIGIPLAIAALIWSSVSGEEVVDPDVDNTGGRSGGSSINFRDCNSSEFLSQGCKSEKIKELQTCIGFVGKQVDGLWGPVTQKRMIELGLSTGILVSDIVSICDTFNKVKNKDQSDQKNDLQNDRQKMQDRNSVRYFSGEEQPYADYDTKSLSTNSTTITGTNGAINSDGPSATY